MKPRERILAALRHEEPDRVPRFEIWVDGLLEELCHVDASSASANNGQDCVMMPSLNPPQSNAWRTGVDEWGRVWKDGSYADGVVKSQEDLERFSPPLSVWTSSSMPIRLGGPGKHILTIVHTE